MIFCLYTTWFLQSNAIEIFIDFFFYQYVSKEHISKNLARFKVDVSFFFFFFFYIYKYILLLLFILDKSWIVVSVSHLVVNRSTEKPLKCVFAQISSGQKDVFLMFNWLDNW